MGAGPDLNRRPYARQATYEKNQFYGVNEDRLTLVQSNFALWHQSNIWLEYF
jgi:hypothetical protein